MPERELPFRAEAQGSNRGILSKRPLVVAVPAHALVAIVIQVEEARIERRSRLSLHKVLQRVKFSRPSKRRLGRSRVSVGIINVAIPRDFALSDDVLPTNDCLI